MNVIIVDDDRTTVEVIEQNMDWKALGIEGVYTAYNIAGAKKIIEAHPIDIVGSWPRVRWTLSSAISRCRRAAA